MKINVRFAPSPTGYLHVGGLRTALYNYILCLYSLIGLQTISNFSLEMFGDQKFQLGPFQN